MNKCMRPTMAMIYCLVSTLSLADVRLTEDGARRLYQAIIASENYLSEIKVGETAFRKNGVLGCFEDTTRTLNLIDQAVQLKWPENEYEKIAFAITRETKNSVRLELAINKGVADGADIPVEIDKLFRKGLCRKISSDYPYYRVLKHFTVTSIEGLTDISDIIDRAEHLSKVYAK